MQSNENSAEIKLDSEGEPITSRSERKINKKIILLITIILIIIGSSAVYFLFLDKEDDGKLPIEENTEVLEGQKEIEIDKELDSDQDELPDYIEKILGTDSDKIDTDGDTYSDFDEIKNGYNPLNDEKLIEEEWEDLKNEIKNKNEGLYEEMFGNSDKTIDDCDAFPNKLDLCESFSCKFKHPFTGEITEKKIIGLVNGKCKYIEEMPNNGKMDCEYSESLRKAVAQYHRDLAIAESAGTSVKADKGNGDIKITYTIDGKEVENPFQEAIAIGQCVISSIEDNKCPPGTEYKGETYTYENEEQIAHPVCSDPNAVCPPCDNCVSGSAKKVLSGGKEVCYECLFDKACKKGFHCFDHNCINNEFITDITQECNTDKNNCDQYSCDTCVKGTKICFYAPVAAFSEIKTSYYRKKCVECDDKFSEDCIEGYTCENYKCVVE